MKNFRILVLILLVALATPFALHRRAWALHHSAASRAAPDSSSARLHITSPTTGQKLEQAYVVVQYEPAPSVASSSPTYQLRLDGRDPIQTSETNYTFGGLKPGSHNVVVQVVDGHGDPASGTRSEVQFTVTAAATGANRTGGDASSLSALPQSLVNDLPSGNGSLPLLSVIGFGILVGGVISALRTRPAHK